MEQGQIITICGGPVPEGTYLVLEDMAGRYNIVAFDWRNPDRPFDDYPDEDVHCVTDGELHAYADFADDPGNEVGMLERV